MRMMTNISSDPIKQATSNLPCRLRRTGALEWRQTAEHIGAANGKLLTLWGADDRDRDNRYRVYAAYFELTGITVLEHAIDSTVNPNYPSIAEIFPSALRMERAVYDLVGIRSSDPDHRGWLRHGGWPEDAFPLRRDFDASTQFPVDSVPYPFVQVAGDGVHEIPVGPVHAGIIEPGNFRFSVVGERVLRLEERLGYTHKGIEKRFESLALSEGHKLAARVSGDSAVAYSWAYCAALESIAQTICPQRATQLRALSLEHERIANHLGDLGALGNDAGFAFGLTHFSALKEALLRVNRQVFGARYLMDFIVPGGVAFDPATDAAQTLISHYVTLEAEVAAQCAIYANHAGVQDGFHETGTLTFETASILDAAGLAARASGIAFDLRADLPWAPYDSIKVNVISRTSGDVAARADVRFDEIVESLRICRILAAGLAAGDIQVPLASVPPKGFGVGVIEGWRGPVAIALESGPAGSIRRCHVHDPSWQNWPLLEQAILGNIVPDFPLINKSFNLSYSGQDG